MIGKSLLYLILFLTSVKIDAQEIPGVIITNRYMYAVIDMGDTGLTFICDDEHYRMYVTKTENDSTILIYSEEMGILHWENPIESESYFSDDTIVLATYKEMSASSAIWYFQWDGEKINELDVEFFNANEGMFDSAATYLEDGKIRECVAMINGIQYPFNEFDTWDFGIRIMEKVHSLALKQFELKNYDSASNMMQAAFEYWENGNMIYFSSLQDFIDDRAEGFSIWSDEQFQLWVGDYGLFLYKAKRYDEAIEINRYLNMILPEVAGPYLQLGDSYYDSEKKRKQKLPIKNMLN